MAEHVTVARHICASPYHEGPRWLPACYFYRNKRHRTGLQSYCMTCTKINMRVEHLPEKTKRKRADHSREYKQRQRRQNGVEVRTLHNPRFDGKRLAEWLDERTTKKRESNGKADFNRMYLNGIPIAQVDQRFIARLRSGSTETASLERVDRIAVDYDLPLWEMQEVAQRYQRDKRRRKRTKR